jgi:hypothetical protein
VKIGQFVEANLAWILSGALALYTGYIVGESKTTNRMDMMADRIIELRAEVAKSRKVEACLTYHAVRLETGLKGDVPRCGTE